MNMIKRFEEVLPEREQKSLCLFKRKETREPRAFFSIKGNRFFQQKEVKNHNYNHDQNQAVLINKIIK